jgi:hypothetical protein
MKTYLVRDVNSPRSRIVEADGFIIEESGYTRFEDEDSNLIARFINVEIEPWSATRESSEELAELAQKYLDFEHEDKTLQREVRSLAGSVLSQASKD